MAREPAGACPAEDRAICRTVMDMRAPALSLLVVESTQAVTVLRRDCQRVVS